MTEMTALAIRRETADVVLMPEFESTATDVIQDVITHIGHGTISLRDAERLRQKTSTLSGVVENIERIAKHGENIARSGARLVRDMEQFATEVDEFQTKRAENDARRAEADARRAYAPEAVREEQRVRTLTAQNLGDELQEQIDARRAAREREKQRVDQERATAEQRVDRRRASRDARVDAARRKNEGEAARIVRDVQIGAVPADPAHPYHAYAACIYLAARLEDDLSSEEAAARTRDAVLGLMLGPTVAPDEIAAYHAAYLDLKERAKAAAKHRDTTELLAAAEAFAGGVQ
jgi:chromosome segregation ATPase